MIILLFAFAFFGWENQNPVTYNVRIYDQSELKIFGESNVNTFSFQYNPQYLQEGMSVSVKSNSERISFNNAVLKLKVKGFDSGHKIMNNDLYDLLKADRYPNVSIDFQSAIPQLKATPYQSLTVNAKVFMAGQVHNEVIVVKAIKAGEKYHYVGKTKLNLHNYSIDPPVKFMGLVKVHEELTINFDLLFEAVQNS